MLIFGSEKSIIVQTRKGTNINNFQCKEISQTNQNYFNLIESKYPKAQKRSKPSGLYNCHGMTFADRRTFIEDPKEVHLILKEDDYKEIKNRDKVLPGDIIIYFSDGDVQHSGIVIKKPEEPCFIPLVISKWACHAEFIHYANDCPYDSSNIKYYRIFE